MICEPGEQYVGYITPVSGTNSGTAKCILKYLEDIDINEMEAICCDGTATTQKIEWCYLQHKIQHHCIGSTSY